MVPACKVQSASWNPDRTNSFINFCYKEISENASSRGDNSGFKAVGWTRILSEFNSANNLQYSKEQLSSKFFYH